MGFNTTVVVMNDALSDIQRDPDFGKNLAAAILKLGLSNEPRDVHAGTHVNAATVIETHHADGVFGVLVGGNYGESLGRLLGYRYDLSELESKKALLRSLADRLGLKISIGERK